MRDSVYSEQDLNKIVALTSKPKGNQTIKAQRILCRMINWDKNRVLEFLRKPSRLKGIETVGLKTKIELIEYFKMFDINHQSFINYVGSSNPATSNYLDITDNDDYFSDLLEAIIIHESNLSTRARNALQDILNNGNDYIIEILLDQSTIRRLKSVGLKTEIELITFCWKILIEIKDAKILEKDHSRKAQQILGKMIHWEKDHSRKAQQILGKMIHWDKNHVLEFLRKPSRLKGIETVGLKTKTELIEYFSMFAINQQSFNEYVGSRKPATSNYLDITNNDDYFSDLLKAIIIHESNLSTRARNTLQDILNNGNDYIIEILLDQSKIRRLKRVGLKTEIELINFCMQILIEIKDAKILEKDHLKESDESSSSDVKNVNQLINENTQHLKPFREHIVAFLTHTAETLPTRAANGIRKVLKKDFDELCCYLIGSREILSIEGIGKRHENEIKKTFNSCLKHIDSLLDNNFQKKAVFKKEAVFRDDQNLFVKLSKFFIDEDNVFAFLNRVKQKGSGFIPLYSLICEILKSNFFLKKRERNIFFHSIGLFEYKKLEKKVIASKYGLSKERVRQILEKANRDIYSKKRSFLTSKRFPEILSNYELYDGLFEDIIFVNPSFVEKINRIENANFSFNDVLFITTLLPDNLYKNLNNLVFEKTEYFFIKKDLLDIFNFGNFMTDMKEKVDAKRETRLELDFEGYLLSFMQKRDIQALNRLKPICEELIFKRFGMTVSADNTLIFDINKNVLRSVIYDILKEKRFPMNISEIIEQLKVRLPEHEVSDGNIRATILRFKEFGTIGRESTYYLKEWNHVKGGTMGDLVVEFLNERNGIAHISTISNYIVKYRKTTQYNIMNNLKLDSRRRFAFQANGYVRLNGKYE
jgi:hypothetical protein